MTSPGFGPRLYGTAVSVTNHYTGWAGSYRSGVITKGVHATAHFNREAVDQLVTLKFCVSAALFSQSLLKRILFKEIKNPFQIQYFITQITSQEDEE
ncbi:hypothetical protein TNCV_1373231 [Trichonephila clavipes]|uniref:Uncharacterized protein n=1 Tax=Trichonephila clavipes TaxID=2585209 RepID=A0A8X6WHI3_TRICX|nr:hypothetical protein TNCV_1373231 [Trichonephila clavipes]